MNDWKKYQEDAAAYFRLLGLDASTDVTVKGVRTSHNIDVYVKSHYVGFCIIWIVECKHWKTAVSKLHVLALREIVSDIGADRGILLSESGFQNGAIEAANLTNVQVTSIAEMYDTAGENINAMRIRELFDRVGVCNNRYWEIPKDRRIKAGLRPDSGGYGYSGDVIIKVCTDLLTHAFRGKYPFQIKSIELFALYGREKQFESARDVIDVVAKKITELETKLDICEHLNGVTQKGNPAEF